MILWFYIYKLFCFQYGTIRPVHPAFKQGSTAHQPAWGRKEKKNKEKHFLSRKTPESNCNFFTYYFLHLCKKKKDLLTMVSSICVAHKASRTKNVIFEIKR